VVDFDFYAFDRLRDAKVLPFIWLSAENLHQMAGLARSLIRTSSFQDRLLAASQVVALHLQNETQSLAPDSALVTLTQDLTTLLAAAETTWSESMKLEAVNLANITLLQRDSIISRCQTLNQEEQDFWRSQSFLSECVFGIDTRGRRRPSRPPMEEDAVLHLGAARDPLLLDLADRVLLATEMRTLVATPDSPWEEDPPE
jgi:hypothetical protein